MDGQKRRCAQLGYVPKSSKHQGSFAPGGGLPNLPTYNGWLISGQFPKSSHNWGKICQHHYVLELKAKENPVSITEKNSAEAGAVLAGKLICPPSSQYKPFEMISLHRKQLALIPLCCHLR